MAWISVEWWWITVSARSGATLSAEYRRNRAKLLRTSDHCHLCGHGGARTADHVISRRNWPAGVPGVDSLANLAPAHGTMGSGRWRLHNPCPICGQLCNQVKKAGGGQLRPRSRAW